MERKVHANIEFQVIEGETCRKVQDHNLENACNFLPSEAVALFYEYPVSKCQLFSYESPLNLLFSFFFY